ncbi:hypothetical protein V7124_21125 [Neobacillus niacini]|uniref:hypothetical protein n=1 Tax=Neobacillus niacini TaxID=86668 RepID=UPI002FFF9CAF
MKKVLTLLFTSLLVFLMFVGPGNVALAHEGDSGCGCVVEEISGAEKNKIVSNLLKSDEFKIERKGFKEVGFKWNGVNAVEVIYNHSFETMMIGLPVYNVDDTIWTAVFFDGVLVGISPPETH